VHIFSKIVFSDKKYYKAIKKDENYHTAFKNHNSDFLIINVCKDIKFNYVFILKRQITETALLRYYL
jgi:hypothetical protein